LLVLSVNRIGPPHAAFDIRTTREYHASAPVASLRYVKTVVPTTGLTTYIDWCWYSRHNDRKIHGDRKKGSKST